MKYNELRFAYALPSSEYGWKNRVFLGEKYYGKALNEISYINRPYPLPAVSIAYSVSPLEYVKDIFPLVQVNVGFSIRSLSDAYNKRQGRSLAVQRHDQASISNVPPSGYSFSFNLIHALRSSTALPLREFIDLSNFSSYDSLSYNFLDSLVISFTESLVQHLFHLDQSIFDNKSQDPEAYTSYIQQIRLIQHSSLLS